MGMRGGNFLIFNKLARFPFCHRSAKVYTCQRGGCIWMPSGKVYTCQRDAAAGFILPDGCCQMGAAVGVYVGRVCCIHPAAEG